METHKVEGDAIKTKMLNLDNSLDICVMGEAGDISVKDCDDVYIQNPKAIHIELDLDEDVLHDIALRNFDRELDKFLEEGWNDYSSLCTSILSVYDVNDLLHAHNVSLDSAFEITGKNHEVRGEYVYKDKKLILRSEGFYKNEISIEWYV